MRKLLTLTLAASALALTSTASVADEFTQEDVDEWYAEYMAVVADGRAAFTDGTLGTNGVVCAQCHPNASNTHPETYPKFQKQLGRVAVLADMVNWCIQNPLEGQPLAFDDPKMIALQTYMTHERRGVALDPGKH